ncbi:MAG: type II toxin-antitoxin system RelE/ParE family toxin [Ginsengibacter sp.]
MVYEIIFKKRFRNKLEKVFFYLENEFGYLIAEKFAQSLNEKFNTLQGQPYIGVKSTVFSSVRSISAGKQNRIYYRIEGNKVVVLNMYDTRINPIKNKFK